MQEAQLLVQDLNCLIGNSEQFVWAPFAAILLNAVLHFWVCQVRKPRQLVQSYLGLAYVCEKLVNVSPY